MYDELFKIWSEERKNTQLQPFTKDLYSKLIDYVRKIKKEKSVRDEKTTEGKILKKEEENTVRMIEDLIKLRYEKIINIVASGKTLPSKILTEEEEKLLNENTAQFNSYMTFLKKIMQVKKFRNKKNKPSGLKVVEILKNLPQIIGVDMKTYGPFKAGDIATISEDNANMLIKQCAAKEKET
jgi:DNA replication factor GINS